MVKLTIDYFTTPGAISLMDNEKVVEANGNGEYYDYKYREAKRCFLIFTNLRLLIYVSTVGKKKPFCKLKEKPQLAAEAKYDSIASLSRMKVGSDDSFCRAEISDGTEIAFNIVGEVFGPLAKRIENLSGREIPRNSVIKHQTIA